MREFMGDGAKEFSSFAELVGLTKSFDVALAPLCTSDFDTKTAVSANIDAAVTAWSSLLPSSKKTLQRPDGSIDEILFKAHAIIFSYVSHLTK